MHSVSMHAHAERGTVSGRETELAAVTQHCDLRVTKTHAGLPTARRRCVVRMPTARHRVGKTHEPSLPIPLPSPPSLPQLRGAHAERAPPPPHPCPPCRSCVMRMLNEYDVMLEGILLKPNMCLPGERREDPRRARAPRYWLDKIMMHPARQHGRRSVPGSTPEHRARCTQQQLAFGHGRSMLRAPPCPPCRRPGRPPCPPC